MKKGKRVTNEKNVHTKRRMNNKLKKRLLISILVIIVLIILFYIINNYIIFGKNKKINLVINNNNITSNLKNDILIENNVIYLSKADVQNFFDKYIYDDEDNNQIVTTYEKKIATIGFDKKELVINGSNKKIDASLIKKDDITYLPISEMKDVYNIEIENIENSKVITMESLDREKKEALVKKSVAVKSNTNFISKTIDRVKKGDRVVIISSENGNTKIRTSNGKIGYVKSNKLENEYIVRESLEDEEQIKGKVNLIWDYYSEYAKAPDRSNENIEGINVVSPAFFYLDEDSKFKENIGNDGKKYIEWAHNNGYKVWPMFSNANAATKDINITSEIMNDYNKRHELIENIIDSCVSYKLDGINIDFENMKAEDKDMFSRFIIELTPRMKEIGLVTSVDVTAPDGGETWSMCFNRNVIGDVADYIVFMAYDEYGVSSNKPGTNAGYDWVKLNLKDKFLNYEAIEPNKIILALPLYTRVWTTNSSGKVSSKTIDMKNIVNQLPNGVEKKWDEDLKQYYVEYNEGSNKKQMWIEDIESLKAKISLVKEFNLAGIGAWQKDMESDDVWEMFKQELNF